MPRTVFQNNLGSVSLNNARSVRAPSIHGFTFGAVLVYFLLLSALIGKSYLWTLRPGVWRVQMMATVIGVGVDMFYSLLTCSRQRVGHYSSKLP